MHFNKEVFVVVEDKDVGIATGKSSSTTPPTPPLTPSHVGHQAVSIADSSSAATQSDSVVGPSGEPAANGDSGEVHTETDGAETTDACPPAPRSIPFTAPVTNPSEPLLLTAQQTPVRPIPPVGPSLPTFADMFIIHSTVKGLVSLRNRQEGTSIETLCVCRRSSVIGLPSLGCLCVSQTCIIYCRLAISDSQRLICIK